MTQADFLHRLAGLAKLCQFELSKDIVRLYDLTLSRLGYPLAVKAIDLAIVRRRGSDRMPSIADLVALVRPEEQQIDTAEEVAGRIVDAVSKFGYSNAGEAMAFIGEVGEYVVQRSGGWVTICGTMTVENTTIMRAQFRGMALSAIRRNAAGTLQVTPSFGKPSAAPAIQAKLQTLSKGVAKEVHDNGAQTNNSGDHGAVSRAPGAGEQRGKAATQEPEALPPPLHPRE
jgi:hypothetical protein